MNLIVKAMQDLMLKNYKNDDCHISNSK